MIATKNMTAQDFIRVAKRLNYSDEYIERIMFWNGFRLYASTIAKEPRATDDEMCRYYTQDYGLEFSKWL